MFEYLRNKHLDAKNAFDLPDCGSGVTGACGETPELNRHQFGFSLGGPLRSNKTFFFTAVEYLHLRQADTRFATVPSLAQKAAALAAVPAGERSTPGLNIFNLYPDANDGDPQTSNRYLSAPVIKQRVPAFVGKTGPGDRQ